jgi:hypothetical protein
MGDYDFLGLIPLGIRACVARLGAGLLPRCYQNAR